MIDRKEGSAHHAQLERNMNMSSHQDLLLCAKMGTLMTSIGTTLTVACNVTSDPVS